MATPLLSSAKKISIYLDFVDPESIDYDNNNLPGIEILSYERGNGAMQLGCLERCLNLKVSSNIKWKEILEKNRLFVFYTKVELDSIPVSEGELKISGNIDVGLNVNLGF